jgi:hypothetical protein
MKFEPINPDPPVTKIFMTDFPESIGLACQSKVAPG